MELIASLLELPRGRVMRQLQQHLSAQDRLELRKLTHTSDLEHRILLNPIEFVATCTVVGTLLGLLLGTLVSSSSTSKSQPVLVSSSSSPAMRGLTEKGPVTTRTSSAHRTIKHLLSFL